MGIGLIYAFDEFKNLQLLNPETEKERLVGIMKNWADGLGVRCNHCHVGENAATLEGFSQLDHV